MHRRANHDDAALRNGKASSETGTGNTLHQWRYGNRFAGGACLSFRSPTVREGKRRRHVNVKGLPGTDHSAAPVYWRKQFPNSPLLTRGLLTRPTLAGEQGIGQERTKFSEG